MNNEDLFKLLFVIAFIILLNSYMSHNDDANKLQLLQEEVNSLKTENINLQNQIKFLESENQNLRQQQADIYDELANYAALEVGWELLPNKKIRHLCKITQILLKQNFPAIEDIPC